MPNSPGTPRHEITSDEETIDPQTPDLTWTPDPSKMRAHRQVVGVENVWGKAYGKATGLYSKHRKYSEQWNPWHPFQSAHDFEQAQSFSQQKKSWIDQHLMREQDKFKTESFQLVDAQHKLLSELNFRLGDNHWIPDLSLVFGTLCYRHIFKCI